MLTTTILNDNRDAYMLSLVSLRSRTTLRSVRDAGLLIFVGTATVIAWIASLTIVTGSRELLFWDTITISNKNALFFFLLMSIGGSGGYVSSKMSNKYLKAGVLVITYTLVFAVGLTISKSLPFRF